mmetsp:Transcript_100979/g.324202  ORF Transcript_100979/g.324202 Transcript_100979/m.324202 type:complete len:214 (-) Transcript_100979:1926-2567(-)
MWGTPFDRCDNTPGSRVRPENIRPEHPNQHLRVLERGRSSREAAESHGRPLEVRLPRLVYARGPALRQVLVRHGAVGEDGGAQGTRTREGGVLPREQDGPVRCLHPFPRDCSWRLEALELALRQGQQHAAPLRLRDRQGPRARRGHDDARAEHRGSRSPHARLHGARAGGEPAAAQEPGLRRLRPGRLDPVLAVRLEVGVGHRWHVGAIDDTD